MHGSVTPTLLACAFLPLLKNALKNPADPNSYRAIAGSSIILKLFDKVVLLLWGHLLCTDTLQFGYKVGRDQHISVQLAGAGSREPLLKARISSHSYSSGLF